MVSLTGLAESVVVAVATTRSTTLLLPQITLELIMQRPLRTDADTKSPLPRER